MDFEVLGVAQVTVGVGIIGVGFFFALVVIALGGKVADGLELDHDGWAALALGASVIIGIVGGSGLSFCIFALLARAAGVPLN